MKHSTNDGQPRIIWRSCSLRLFWVDLHYKSRRMLRGEHATGSGLIEYRVRLAAAERE